MSYYECEPQTRKGKIGKEIYFASLYDRRGFRDDQLGIEDVKIWDEIFEDIGEAAINAVTEII